MTVRVPRGYEAEFLDRSNPWRTRQELITQYGEENGNCLFEEFSAFRRHYSLLTYISTGIESDDAFRARVEAEKKGMGRWGDQGFPDAA